MRMWMVDPKHMCNKHLLGEHVECHMFAGHLSRKRSIKGYIKSNCVESMKLLSRHDELANEMIRRGMKHKSPLEEVNIDYLGLDKYATVDRKSSENDLFNRCEECNSRRSLT